MLQSCMKKKAKLTKNKHMNKDKNKKMRIYIILFMKLFKTAKKKKNLNNKKQATKWQVDIFSKLFSDFIKHGFKKPGTLFNWYKLVKSH